MLSLRHQQGDRTQAVGVCAEPDRLAAQRSRGQQEAWPELHRLPRRGLTRCPLSTRSGVSRRFFVRHGRARQPAAEIVDKKSRWVGAACSAPNLIIHGSFLAQIVYGGARRGASPVTPQNQAVSFRLDRTASKIWNLQPLDPRLKRNGL